MGTREMPPPAAMMKIILGKWISKPIHVAAELGLADILSEGPKSPSELARLTGTKADLLHRLLRSLAAVGIFAQQDDGRFELTALAECLRTGALRASALMFLSGWHDRAWEHLAESLRTGQCAFELAHGFPAFEWFDNNPEAAKVFNEANAIKAAVSHRAVIQIYDFSTIKRLTDVGGGYGALLAEILLAHPHMTGILADRPSLSKQAEKYLKTRGLAERARVVPCDFFESVPEGSEAILLSHILHNWDDEACLALLANCRKAVPPGAKLLALENIIPSGNVFSLAKLMDLEMLVMGGGKERTEDEFRRLFHSAGFRLTRLVPIGDDLFLLEGSPS